jgi:hypothetical protein
MISSVPPRAAAAFSAAVFIFVILMASSQPIWGDSVQSYLSAAALLDTGHLSIPAERLGPTAQQAPDGKFYSKYPLLTVVNSLPAVVLVRALMPRAPELRHPVITIVPAAWTALLALCVLLLLARLGVPWPVAAGMTAAMIVSTPLWIYSRLYSGEGSQAALLAALLLCAHAAVETERRTWAALAGAAAGLALCAKTTFAVLLPMVLLALPLRLWWAYLAGCLPGFVAWGAFNALRWGAPWALGYGGGRDADLGFATPLLSGLFGNFLSPGKSIFLYAPVLVLAPWGARALVKRRPRFWFLAWAAPMVVLIMILSRWWCWSGDFAWGPRLLVPLIPWMALPAHDLWTWGRPGRIALAAAAVVGFCVQWPAILLPEAIYITHLWVLTRPAMLALASQPDKIPDDLALLHYLPTLSPIPNQWWLVWAKAFGPQAAGAPPWSSGGLDQIAAQPDLARVSWEWWCDGSPRALALAAILAILLVAAIAGLIRETRRRTR